MDTMTTLAEAVPTAVDSTKPVDEVRLAPGKIYHFDLYGQGSRADLAAFAAARVLLENAIRRRGRDGKAAGAQHEAARVGHYFARFLTGSRNAGRAADRKSNSGSPDRDGRSRDYRHRDKPADLEEAQTQFVITVLLGPQQRGNMAAAESRHGSPRCGTFDFTVVNNSDIECVRATPGRP
jgi:hypothetical protein